MLKTQDKFTLPSLVRFLYLRELGVNDDHYKRNTALRYAEARAAMSASNMKCEVSTVTKSTFVVTFSPDGRLVASSHGDHSVRVSDLRTGKCMHNLTGHPRTPWTLAFHPCSSDILASGCLAGEVRIWDLKGGGSEVWKVPARTVIASLAFHPLDQVLVFSTANIIYFWEWARQQPFASTETANGYEKVRWVKFDCSGQYLYTGIANSATIQRDEPLEASRFSNNVLSEDAFGDVLRERHRLRQQYRNMLSRFGHTPYDLPSTSRDVDLDPGVNSEFGLVTQPVLPNNHSSAIDEARLYAARVTREALRAGNPEIGRNRAPPRSGDQGRQSEFRTNTSGQLAGPDSEEDEEEEDDTDDDVSRLSTSSRGVRDERTPLEHDFRNFRVRSLQECAPRNENEANSWIGGPESSFVPYTTQSEASALALRQPQLSFSQFASLLDSRPATPSSTSGSLSPAVRTNNTPYTVVSTGTTEPGLSSENLLTTSVANITEESYPIDPVRVSRTEAAPVTESMGTPLVYLRDTTGNMSRDLTGTTTRNTNGNVSSDTFGRLARDVYDGTSRELAQTDSLDYSGSLSRNYSRLSSRNSAEILTGDMINSRALPRDPPGISAHESTNRSVRVRARLVGYRERRNDALSPYSLLGIDRSCEERLAANRIRARRHYVGLERRQSASRIRRAMLAADDSRRVLQQHQCSATSLRDCQCPDQFLARRRERCDSNDASTTNTAFSDSNSTTPRQRETSHIEPRDMSRDGARVSRQEMCDRSSETRDVQNTKVRDDDAICDGGQRGKRPRNASPSSSCYICVDPVREPAGKMRRKVRHTDNDCDQARTSVSDANHTNADTRVGQASNIPISNTGINETDPTVTNSNTDNVVQGATSFSTPASDTDAPGVDCDSTSRRAIVYSSLSAATSRYLRGPQHLNPCLPSGASRSPDLVHGVQPENNNYERPYNSLLHSLRRRILDLHEQLQRTNRTDLSSHNAASSSGTRVNIPTTGLNDANPITVLSSLIAERNVPTSPEEEARLLDPRLLQRRNAITRERRNHYTEERAILDADPTSEFEHLMDESVTMSGMEELTPRWRQRQVHRPHVIPEITISRPTDSPSSMLDNTDSDDDVVPETAGDERSTLLRNLNLVRFEAMRVRFLQREREREHENQSFERRWSRTWRQLQRRHLHTDYVLDEGFVINQYPHSFYRRVPGAFTGPNDPSLASNIVPLTHRIQYWDTRRYLIPDISHIDNNIIVPQCKLHNDSSIDLSLDGQYLAVFVPIARFPDDIMLCVYSLGKDTLGQCLFSRTFGGPNAVCVSISPRSEHILVGLAAKRTAWVWPPNHLVAQVFSLKTKETNADPTMRHVSDIVHPYGTDLRTQHVSINSAKWLPIDGWGLIYGTNRGHLIVKTPGLDGRKVSRGGDHDELEGHSGAQVYAPTPLRRNIMEMLGLAPRTTSTSTQTSDEQPSLRRLRAITTTDNHQPSNDINSTTSTSSYDSTA